MVESAGLLEHVPQHRVSLAQRTKRPDMLILLPRGPVTIPIDVKVPLSAFLDVHRAGKKEQDKRFGFFSKPARRLPWYS